MFSRKFTRKDVRCTVERANNAIRKALKQLAGCEDMKYKEKIVESLRISRNGTESVLSYIAFDDLEKQNTVREDLGYPK